MEEVQETLCKVAIVCGQRILLARRSKWVLYSRGRWDIFGGAVDHGESRLEAAVRECKEEAGLDLKGSDLMLLAEMPGDRLDHKAMRVCYKLSVYKEFEPKLSFEHSEFRWMSKDEMLATDLPDFYKDACIKALS